ncbi:MAG: hypothetical protein IAE80_16635 [Anaerolinea sp.]|nr:hypothetical protein [Anaerolinea sp.]
MLRIISYSQTHAFRKHVRRLAVPLLLVGVGILLIGAALLLPQSVQAQETVPMLPIENGRYFDTSGVCATCHSNMFDEHGNNISFDSAWRATMMGNSGRDPYWRAGLRREVLSNPDFADFIQDKCATCHMPMARTTANLATGEYLAVFGENGAVTPGTEYHTLAVDSVSCALCHQITPEHLGTREGSSGHYVIDGTTDDLNRVIYGPFAPNAAQAAFMQASTGGVQTQSDHVAQSELCAACHELYTPYFDVETRELAPVEFQEQTPYTEWLNSDYRNSQSCQTCHMPVVDGLAMAASLGNPIPAMRTNVSQHTLLGGNVYLPRILQTFGEELEVAATDEQFQAYIDATRAQLQNDTARITLQNVVVTDNILSLDVFVQSLVGHKFPTAYPSRRTWLHVTVTDASGAVVFESGGYQDNGFIVGNANDEDALQFEPHYDVITAPDQVQIYEPVMGDTAGHPTTTLLLASQYLKDNRILPLGYDPATVPVEIAVWGDAATDPDFVGGSDIVTYQIPVTSATGLTVEVELVYQTLGYRWADNLREFEDPEIAPEIVTFLRYYDAVPNIPELVANDSAVIP